MLQVDERDREREERWWWWWWWWAKETVKKTPSVFTKENIVHERVPFLFCPLPTLHTLHFLRYIIPFVPSLSLCSIAVIIIIIAIIAIEIVIVILLLCHPPQSHSTQSRLSLATFPPCLLLAKVSIGLYICGIDLKRDISLNTETQSTDIFHFTLPSSVLCWRSRPGSLLDHPL